ncbi:MAG: type II toxin-antitoxin system VapC family toxin [Planctomycetes bacterium]|nr:type II toxin-antitoxin system VapC family toxin [Planctomycetota bacterium]
MARRTVFLDTSFVVALENRDDPSHQRAQSLDRELLAEDATLLLHWGILFEIGDGYSRLGRRSKGIELLKRMHQEQGYQIVSITDALLAKALTLYCDRVDKDWGLTDCLSFVVMEQEGVMEALTADRHFAQAGFKPLLLPGTQNG